MNWSMYFEMMQDWKKLPAYKAEPRIDSLIGYYLPDFLSDYLNEPSIIGTIPELPLRLGTLMVKDYHGNPKYADLSYKVDFYALGMTGMNYFVEFKTDVGSRNTKQDGYLDAVKKKSMGDIIDGIMRIASVTSVKYKPKYDHLISKLKSCGLIDSGGVFKGSDEIMVIYVQPHISEDIQRSGDRIIDFKWLSEWLQKQTCSSDFEMELSKALLKWHEADV